MARTEATHEQRILSLDALSEWGSVPAAPTAWSTVADVASRSIDLINAAGSDTLRTRAHCSSAAPRRRLTRSAETRAPPAPHAGGARRVPGNISSKPGI